LTGKISEQNLRFRRILGVRVWVTFPGSFMEVGVKLTARALVLGTVLLLTSAAPAIAQGTLGAGISFIWPGEDQGTYTGFTVDYSAPVHKTSTMSIGFVGDYTYAHHSEDVGVNPLNGSNDSVGLNLNLFQGGVRVTGTTDAKIKPFGQFLLGGAHFSCCGESETDFVITFGGGVDFHVSGRTNVRAQIDIPVIFFEGDSDAATRLFLGLSWSLGK
jgi:hypothetical protein